MSMYELSTHEMSSSVDCYGMSLCFVDLSIVAQPELVRSEFKELAYVQLLRSQNPVHISLLHFARGGLQRLRQ